VIHRHLDVPTGVPVGELPVTALHDLLDRGDLEDWRPILIAIEDEPGGLVAERVARLVDAYPMYGTSPLLRAWIERCRYRTSTRRWTRPPRQGLSAIRQSLGRTQAEVAQRMGTTQSDYSKLERRGDMRLSTLAAVARAFGGKLRVLLTFSGRQIEIGLDGGSAGRRAALPASQSRRPRRRRQV
jgi:hypothetical protein